jgi:mono/diheme cytochrome c family protein
MVTARCTTWATIAATLALTACVKSPEREPVDFERMRVQQRYEPYGASTVFANAQAMQQSPPGALSRESVRDTGVVGTGLSGGQPVVDVPVPISPTELALGHRKFTIYCAVCHGEGGFGGSIVAENMGPPRPPSLRTEAMLAQPAGYIFDIATHGKGRMPPYSAQLSPDERWAVVAYVRGLQKSPPVTAEQRADSARAVEIQAIDSSASAARQVGGSATRAATEAKRP